MNNRKHIMIDIETMGRRPGAAIVSLAAILFDENGAFMTDNTHVKDYSFYRTIDLQSCMDVGLRVDAQTIRFWMSQEGPARREVLTNGAPLREVLEEFAFWLAGPADPVIWAYGATFDPPLLEMAYHALGMQVPWLYRDVRCARTVLDLADVELKGVGTKHHALDDAIAQADCVARAMRILGKKL